MRNGPVSDYSKPIVSENLEKNYDPIHMFVCGHASIARLIEKQREVALTYRKTQQKQIIDQEWHSMQTYAHSCTRSISLDQNRENKFPAKNEAKKELSRKSFDIDNNFRILPSLMSTRGCDDSRIIHKYKEPSIKNRRLFSRSQQVLAWLSNRVHKFQDDRISLEELLHGKTSFLAARLFYDLMYLKSNNHLKIDQGEPFGNIFIFA